MRKGHKTDPMKEMERHAMFGRPEDPQTGPDPRKEGKAPEAKVKAPAEGMEHPAVKEIHNAVHNILKKHGLHKGGKKVEAKAAPKRHRTVHKTEKL